MGVAVVPAFAADLPVKAAGPVVMPPVPLANWTGFYIGGHGGFGWGDSRWTFTQNSFWNNVPGDTIRTQPDGWLAGGQIGYNYQMGPWLLGIEGTLSAADISDTVRSPIPPAAVFGNDRLTTKMKSLYTIAARVGVVWNQFLFYGKGGWAGGQVELSASTDFGGGAAWNPGSKSRSGWVAGAGMEYMIMPNLILGVEYNYIDLGSATYSAPNTGPGAAGFLPATTIVEDRTHVQTIVGRVSWLFN
jgi:outer membrane immunogenic protein